MNIRTLFRAAIVAVAMVATPSAVFAANLPCRTAKLIVPWKPGGGTDVIFRIFANAINGYGVKPEIQVVNVSGQGGNKGAKEAKRSDADGCTLFAIHQSAVTSYLNGRVDFTWDAFDTVALLTSTPDIVGASKTAPYDSLEEMLNAGRKNPETILTGATFGSTSQFMWLLMEDKTGAKFKYVPFDGTRERMTALLSGTIQLGTINVASGKKYINTGELKAYAIAADERSDQVPDLPTLKELGVDMTYTLDRGIMAPKGTPKEAIDHWASVFKRALEDPSVQKQMKTKGTGLRFLGPEEYAAWFKRIYDDHEKVAVKIGMYKK